MRPHEPASTTTLAGRLRDLRDGGRLTQKDIADALGKSVALISSWESGQARPPDGRLREYARLFATPRSVQDGVVRLLDDTELSPAEAEERDRLFNELLGLRDQAFALQSVPRQPVRLPLAGTNDTIGGGSWHFADQRPITIVSSKLSEQSLDKIPESAPTSPDFVASYKYSDLDALIELHGHIRAVNPTSQVTIRAPDEINEDDLTAHVVLLGGIDQNQVTRDLMAGIALPVTQAPRDGEGAIGLFATGDGTEFAPSVDFSDGTTRLIYDVALFYRGVNPNNTLRTLTICTGMFARGTYGVVRALTDARFRDRNERYIGERFAGQKAYCILSRVSVVNQRTLTPDWTLPHLRLFEWPERNG
jgi:transcriptional regulator with XRE-family HTH domain